MYICILVNKDTLSIVLKDVKIRKVLWLIPFVCSVAYSQSESKRICYLVDEFTDEKEVMCAEVVLYGDGGDTETQGAAMRLVLKEKKGKITPSNYILCYMKKVVSIKGVPCM